MPPTSSSELRNQFQDVTTALHTSIRDGKLSRLQSLLNASPPPSDLNQVHEKCGTPLHFAASCGSLDAVELLLAAGANPLSCEPTRSRVLPIDSAVKNGHAQIVELLWSPDIQERESSRMETPSILEKAAEGGHTRIVKYLLVWDGWSAGRKAAALMSATSRWKFDTVTALLENESFPPSTVRRALNIVFEQEPWGGHYYTALWAPEGWDYYNLERLVELFLDLLGAAPNQRQNSHQHAYTLGYIAGNANFTSVLKLYLDKVADEIRQSEVTNDALRSLASPTLVGYGRGRKVMNKTAIRLLLQHGASVAMPDGQGVAPLHIAAQRSDLDSFRLFLSLSTVEGEDEQALLSLANNHQETLLHYAAAGHQVDIITYLVSHGLDVNARNSNGWTPLMCALIPGSAPPAIEVALLLLNHGADPALATYEGWTPLHALALHCDLDIRGRVESLANQLIARGVDPEALAPLISLARRSISDVPFDIPWGYRLTEALSSWSRTPVVVQPNLTPLLWAAQRGAVGVVRALLNAGVDITVLDANGMTAAAMAWEIRAVPKLSEAADVIVGLLF